MGRPERILIVAVLAALLTAGAMAVQDETRLPPSKLMIDQVYVDLPDVDVFLWATDSAGALVSSLDKARLALALDKAAVPMPADAILEPFRGMNEGVAYTILLDVSMSIKEEDLKMAKAAALGLVGKLGAQDKAMLIAFGSAIEILAPFTSDKELLRQKIESVRPVASNTLLYGAIETAFRQNNRYDPAIPHRRAIVVLSDGIDEGSGVSIQDLRELMAYPVYAIGFAGGKRLFVDTLVQISNLSGGRYFHITDLSEAPMAYGKIRDFVESQWHLKLKLCDLEPDNSRKTLDLTLTDTLVLSSQKAIRLFSTKTRQERDKACGRDVPAVVDTCPKRILGICWYWVAGGGLILILLVLLFLLMRRRRRRKKAQAEAEAAQAEAASDIAAAAPGIAGFGPSGPSAAPTEPYPETDGTRDIEPGSHVSFSVLEGPGKGKRFALAFRRGRLRIGRGGLSDLVLDDDEVSSEHATLTREKGFFFIEDNNSRNGVFVNGIRIKTAKRIETGDVLYLGTTKLRFNGEAGKDAE